MKRGFCCGSYDPVTKGHLDLIERAAGLCDSLTVGVARNYSKSCMFSMEQRAEMVRKAISHIPNADVVFFDGHLPMFVLENGYDMIFRGLRGVSDFDYELALAQNYAVFLKGKCETVYLMTDPAYSYISSTYVKQNFMLGADFSDSVPSGIPDLMRKYIQNGEADK